MQQGHRLLQQIIPWKSPMITTLLIKIETIFNNADCYCLVYNQIAYPYMEKTGNRQLWQSLQTTASVAIQFLFLHPPQLSAHLDIKFEHFNGDLTPNI